MQKKYNGTVSVNEKSLFRRTFIILLILNFLDFVVYHTMTYTISGTVPAFVFFYFHEILSFILPLVSALSLFITSTLRGNLAALLRAVPYTLSFIIFYFPYNAFEYAYEGIVIDGVLLFSSLSTLYELIVLYVEITVLYLLMALATGKALNKTELKNKSPIESARAFDLEKPVNCGIFAAAGAMFVYSLVFEVIDTITFLNEASGNYTVGEIIYMVFRYLYLLALMLGSQFILARFNTSNIKED